MHEPDAREPIWAWMCFRSSVSCARSTDPTHFHCPPGPSVPRSTLPVGDTHTFGFARLSIM